MTDQAMHFRYADRELIVCAQDLLQAPTAVIVCPADPFLSHTSGLAQHIMIAAGVSVRQEAEQLIREYQCIDPGMVVFTTAGDLSYTAIIHAVAPRAGDEDPQTTLEQTVSRSLQLCDMHEWSSLALPALGTEDSGLDIGVCARAYFRAITGFWDARHECAVEKVMVCLSEDQLQPFVAALRDHALDEEPPQSDAGRAGDEPAVGHIELSEDDVASLDDDEIDSWFK